MKRKIISAMLVATMLATPAVARQRTATLPDGTIIAVNDFRRGGFIAPSTTVVTVHECPVLDGRVTCTNIATIVAEGRSAAETLLSPVIHALGVVGGAAALRPNRESSSVTVHGPTANATGGEARSSSEAQAEGGDSETEVDVDTSVFTIADASAQSDSSSFSASDSFNVEDSFNEQVIFDLSGPPAPPPPPPEPPIWDGKG